MRFLREVWCGLRGHPYRIRVQREPFPFSTCRREWCTNCGQVRTSFVGEPFAFPSAYKE